MSEDYEKHFEEEHVGPFECTAVDSERRGCLFRGPHGAVRIELRSFDENLPKEFGAAETVSRTTLPIHSKYSSLVDRNLVIRLRRSESQSSRASKPPDQPYLEAEPRTGVGYACTRKPRAGRCITGIELTTRALISSTPGSSRRLRKIRNKSKPDLRHFIPLHLDNPMKNYSGNANKRFEITIPAFRVRRTF